LPSAKSDKSIATMRAPPPAEFWNQENRSELNILKEVFS
jgi:hypothetical protein